MSAILNDSNLVSKLVGKTIATITYKNPWDKGLSITFTDGTSLNVYERMQAGEIQAWVTEDHNGYEVQTVLDYEPMED